MIVTIVYVYVKPKNISDFIKASTINHNNSVNEVGNMRFDVLQDDENPMRFVLYEAYESLATANAHKTTDHYLKWRETVTPWMAKPRNGVKYNSICP